jgi:peptidoglycan/xylan/chitin deacetylase (PgdA/CDA1 family)
VGHLDGSVGEFFGFAIHMNRPDEQRGLWAPRWSPPPLLYASAVIHVGVAAALLLRPQAWPWALSALLANHVVLAAAGLWPRSTLLGSNWSRLPAQAANKGEVAITIDDGPDPDVTPQVLAQLEQHRAKATFFCVGERVLRHPELARDMVRRGHSIENHSQRHRHNFSLLGPRGMQTEIARAQDAIHSTTGTRPQFFRAPAGLRNPFLDPVLTRMNLQLASWTRRGFDTVNGNPDAVLERLLANLAGGDILLLHDGNSARDPRGRPVILDVLPRLLDALHARKLKPVTLQSVLS